MTQTLIKIDLNQLATQDEQVHNRWLPDIPMRQSANRNSLQKRTSRRYPPAFLHIVKVMNVAFKPRVLSENLVSRLTAVNRAVRRLKAMGYRVIYQELEPVVGCLPRIQIERRSDISIADLLDHSSVRNWIMSGGKKLGYALFMDIAVWWEEI